MAGPFTKLLNVQTAVGSILYPDQVMDVDSRSIIDFIDPYTWPNEAIVSPVSTVAGAYKAFDAQGDDFEGPGASFNYAKSVSGGAIVYDGAVGRNLILPPVWKLSPQTLHFLVIIWLQAAPTIASGFNNYLAGFLSSGGVQQWSLVPKGNGSNVINGLDFRVYNVGDTAGAWDLATIPGLDLANGVFNSTVHQLGFEMEVTPDGTYVDQRFYMDGALIGARGSTAKTRDFLANSTSGDAIIGAPSTYSGSTFNGGLKRAEYFDLTLSSRAALDVAALDWAANKSRMGVA